MAKEKKSDSREKRIGEICASINKSAYGGENKNAVTWLGSRDAVKMERFSSGCPDLDDALGGGWPKGRFIELFGPESGGKTTLALHAIAEHQKKYPDEDCALIDTEYSFDEEYAVSLGVNTEYLIVHQPDSGEQALNVLSMLIQSGIRCIVVDSVAALTPKSELEGDVGEGSGMAEQARMMSMALRRLTTEAGSRVTTVFWTNQLREKIGVMFGDNKTTPAGRALKHYSSIRVNVVRIATVKKGPDGAKIAVSSKTKADVKKNKTAPPFRTAQFYITYGIGIDIVAAILDSALKYDVIKQRGSWFSFDGENIAQGRDAVLKGLRGNDELCEKLKEAIGKVRGDNADTKSDGDGPKRTPVAADPDAIDSADTDAEADVEVTDV